MRGTSHLLANNGHGPILSLREVCNMFPCLSFGASIFLRKLQPESLGRNELHSLRQFKSVSYIVLQGIRGGRLKNKREQCNAKKCNAVYFLFLLVDSSTYCLCTASTICCTPSFKIPYIILWHVCHFRMNTYIRFPPWWLEPQNCHILAAHLLV